jgi:hypothetical protein
MPCELGEHRYITKDTPDIAGAFECIARVGAVGPNRMGDALVAAISPKLNAFDPVPGCNAGFLRDDALLVLTMIGPEDAPFGWNSKAGPWQDWRQAVVDAKHGNLDAIVALGIVSGEDCEVDPQIQAGGSATSSRRSPAASSSPWRSRITPKPLTRPRCSP